MEKLLERELMVFKKGEKYDFSKDMREAHWKSL
jgi:hypothetical protein